MCSLAEEYIKLQESYPGGRTDFAGEKSSRDDSHEVLTHLKLLQTKLPPTMRTHTKSLQPLCQNTCPCMCSFNTDRGLQ